MRAVATKPEEDMIEEPPTPEEVTKAIKEVVDEAEDLTITRTINITNSTGMS
jgi:hypothetical protein